jgi:hypothetical protein
VIVQLLLATFTEYMIRICRLPVVRIAINNYT